MLCSAARGSLAAGTRDLTSNTMADLPIDDLNVASNETLITPDQLKKEIPLSATALQTVTAGREVVRNILDGKDHRLFVVKEKLPLRVLVIRGLDVFNASTGFNIDISEWKSSSAASLFMSDLSSLTLHEPTGHLLLLSDESALVVEYAPDGQPISVLPLWRGFNGLQRKVPQPEGLAVGPDGALYVLSEPNLFYRFERNTSTAGL